MNRVKWAYFIITFVLVIIACSVLYAFINQGYTDNERANFRLSQAFGGVSITVTTLEIIILGAFSVYVVKMWRLLSTQPYMRKNEKVMIAKIIVGLMTWFANFGWVILNSIGMFSASGP